MSDNLIVLSLILSTVNSIVLVAKHIKVMRCFGFSCEQDTQGDQSEMGLIRMLISKMTPRRIRENTEEKTTQNEPTSVTSVTELPV